MRNAKKIKKISTTLIADAYGWIFIQGLTAALEKKVAKLMRFTPKRSTKTRKAFFVDCRINKKLRGAAARSKANIDAEKLENTLFEVESMLEKAGFDMYETDENLDDFQAKVTLPKPDKTETKVDTKARGKVSSGGKKSSGLTADEMKVLKLLLQKIS